MSANLTAVASLAVVAVLAYDTFRRHRRDRCKSAVDSAAAALAPQHGITERGITAALQLMKEQPKPIAIDLSHLKDHETRSTFPDTLYDHIFGAVPVPNDDGVEAALRQVIAGAFEVLRLEDDFHKVFTQETLSDLERLAYEAADERAVLDSEVSATRQAVDAQTDLLKQIAAGLGAQGASLDRLRALANDFGGTTANTEDGIVQFLHLKAKDYFALKSEIDAIDSNLVRLSNLKAAAQDAISRRDLDEVEALLARVQEVELDEATKTAEIRADNALLRGRVDQAYRLLMAAADSFAAVDSAEPGRRKWRMAIKLQRHGIRYGGDGLRLSNEMCVSGLSVLSETDTPRDFAASQNTRAIALRNQGTRTGGPEGAALLAEAVDSYRAALRVCTEADHPVDWATTMQNLGNALQ